jgi:hypothetical protein
MRRWEPFRELEQLQEATAQLPENVCWGAGITGEGKQREHKGLTVRVPKPDQARPRHIEVESAAQ